jgi:hypothetical protein
LLVQKLRVTTCSELTSENNKFNNVNSEIMIFTEIQLICICKSQLQITRKHYKNTTLERRIRASYGFCPFTILKVWSYVVQNGVLPKNGEPKHLLWMLAFLKTYNTYDVYASWYKCTPLTFRTWVWKFMYAVASIDNIVSTKKLYINLLY